MFIIFILIIILMIISHVVASTNSNPLYYNFIPIFIKAWQHLFPEVNIVIIVINPTNDNDLQEILTQYSDYIIQYSIDISISTVFVSQVIRLLYPAIIDSNNGVIITDIDMIPMNKEYYHDTIKTIDNNMFITFRDVLVSRNEFPICYNIATPNIWKELFDIKELKDIEIRLKELYFDIDYDSKHGGIGWSFDQKYLFKIIIDYDHLMILNDIITKFNRLDRSNLIQLLKKDKNIIFEQINNSKYSDYHMLRPYDKFKDINLKILNVLLNI